MKKIYMIVNLAGKARNRVYILLSSLAHVISTLEFRFENLKNGSNTVDD